MRRRTLQVECALVIGLALCGSASSARAVDTDGDGVDDAIDVCNNTPLGIPVDAEGRPLGDIDGDCDTDLDDFALFQRSMTGALPTPFGACCRWDGTCDVVQAVDCAAPDTFLGPDTTCDGDPCLGACCVSPAFCVLTHGATCAGIGGMFLGAGTICDPNPCVGPPDMVLVGPGEFEMGDGFGEGDADELPVHDVYLGTYFIDVYEVTNAQYADALNWAWAQGGLIEVTNGRVYQHGGTGYPYCDTHTVEPESRLHWDGSTFAATAGREDHPMERVSWYGAAAFCNWRSTMAGRTPCYDPATWTCDFDADGFRLPTEAEWEKAAGWDPDLQYHFRFGEQTDGCGCYCLDGQRANYWSSGDPFETGDYPWTTPVGYYDGSDHAGTYQTQDAQSYYGCRDMSAGVWEWCHDWYASGYYSSSPYDNPIGPGSSTYRVLRSGAWSALGGSPYLCRSAHRHYSAPDGRYVDVGFRCVTGAE